MSTIDRSKMSIQKEGFAFKPMRPTSKNEQLLANAGLSEKTQLMAFERGGKRRVVLLTDMIYHHVCQGELDDEPFLITF
ncbi:MAG: hypothetical protein AAF490_21315 [Chloroflexota bacterium]